jgi:hypothetical protein
LKHSTRSIPEPSMELEFTKLESHGILFRLGGSRDVPFTAIIRVDEPDYVPSAVRLRARLTSRQFSADLDLRGLEVLERDPKVLSVAPGRVLTAAR